jgi:hypothetical protein
VATAASPLSGRQAAGSEQPWNALATWPSFPPLVHEMLRYSLRGQIDRRNVLVGELASGQLELKASATGLVVTGPDGFEERVPLRESAGESLWSFLPRQCGAYELRGTELIQRIAVNVDPREGDLTRVDPRILPPQWRPAAATSAHVPAEQQPQGVVSLYRWLLSGVVALLIAEPLLAWQFARRRT